MRGEKTFTFRLLLLVSTYSGVRSGSRVSRRVETSRTFDVSVVNELKLEMLRVLKGCSYGLERLAPAASSPHWHVRLLRRNLSVKSCHHGVFFGVRDSVIKRLR